MKIISAGLCLLGISFFAVGCMDDDGAADESGEAGASGVASPLTQKEVPEDGTAEFDDSMPPPGSGDASGQIGSGVEAAGGGATGVTEAGELTGEASTGQEGEKIETDGSDPDNS